MFLKRVWQRLRRPEPTPAEKCFAELQQAANDIRSGVTDTLEFDCRVTNGAVPVEFFHKVVTFVAYHLPPGKTVAAEIFVEDDRHERLVCRVIDAPSAEKGQSS